MKKDELKIDDFASELSVMDLMGLDPDDSGDCKTLDYLRNSKKLPFIKLKGGIDNGVRVYFIPDVMAFLMKHRMNDLVSLTDG